MRENLEGRGVLEREGERKGERRKGGERMDRVERDRGRN